jgi:hypothetical protein
MTSRTVKALAGAGVRLSSATTASGAKRRMELSKSRELEGR